MKARLALAFLAVVVSVPTSVAVGVTLLSPPDNAPEYKLSNFRLEDDNFGRPNLVFDYTRVREGVGQVQIAGRDADGPLRITFAMNVNRASGEVRLNKMFRGGGAYNYEFYFTMPAHWAGTYYGNCLVSNTVRMGNPGNTTSTRRWNDKEQAAYEKQKKFDQTPDVLPEGYEPVRFGVALVAGMPVKASRSRQAVMPNGRTPKSSPWHR